MTAADLFAACRQCGTLIGAGARELCDACLSEHFRQQRDELLVALRAMVAEVEDCGDECWATGDGAEVLASARAAIKRASSRRSSGGRS